MTLFVNLVIDTAGRDGEIARNQSRPEHMCLRWGDIDFYTFQPTRDNNFDIRATVTIRWAKGMSLDPCKYKVHTLTTLFPPTMATQDTLRLLLITAIMDVILVGVHCWQDLLYFRLPPRQGRTGQKLLMKQSMRDVPVLRRNEPWSSLWLQRPSPPLLLSSRGRVYPQCEDGPRDTPLHDGTQIRRQRINNSFIFFI